MEEVKEVDLRWDDLVEYRDKLLLSITNKCSLISELKKKYKKYFEVNMEQLEAINGVELTLVDILEVIPNIANTHMSDTEKKIYKSGPVNRDNADDYMDYMHVLTNYHNGDIQLENIDKYLFFITQNIGLRRDIKEDA